MSGRINYSNLSDSLKEKFNNAGLTEEQVQGLINAGLVDMNTGITNIKNDMANMQKFKLTTDEGQGFGLTNQNADDCVGTGTIYFGENITNSPACATGTWWTIENYITTDGLWGHQIATAWHDNATYIRRKINGTFDGWRRLVENSITDELHRRIDSAVASYKFTDSDGNCQNLGSVDWNTVKRSGYFMGSGTTNAPENSGDWFMVKVMAHNSIWCEQIATAFATTQKRYIRYQTNGSWTAWRSL